MSQGFVRSNAVTDVSMFIGDSPSVDSFSRLRVSTPSYVFDSQLTYDLQPLIFEPITNGSGATVTHDATNRCALMTFSNTPTGGKSYMQTYEYLRYQPGRSQLAFITFNFVETKADTLKFAGYSDGVNGIELQQSDSTISLVLLSGTGVGNQSVLKDDWNMDTMDGLGPSGLTLDFTKAQILVIDFQALYVGRVRVGFDINGSVYYVHQFTHSNIQIYPYIQSANLPIRCGMTCTGTVSTTMNFICSSVLSESGQEDVNGINFSVEGTGTAGNGTRAHLLSLRPKTTFNGITNRVRIAFESVDVLAGANPIYWELCLGQAISGTTAFNDVNGTYSAFEFNTLGSISGSPTIVIASGYVGTGAASRQAVSKAINSKYPITLDVAGSVRSLGTLSMIATGITNTSASRVAFNWKEVR